MQSLFGLEPLTPGLTPDTPNAGFHALLRTLFAPWRRTRGLARLVGGVWGSGRYVGAVDAGAGEELCWLTGRVEKYAGNHLLAGIGL